MGTRVRTPYTKLTRGYSRRDAAMDISRQGRYDATRQRRYKASSTAAVSAAAGYIRNRNVSSIRVEKKVVDLNHALVAIENATGTPTLLNGCVAGSQNYQRIGRKINLKSLQIRGHLFPSDTTTNTCLVRMLIVFDKQSNGAAPTWGDVIKSQNIAGTTSSTVTDMLNLDNRDRFEVIRDKTWSFNYGESSNGYSPCPGSYEITEYIRLSDRPTVYNAGTAGTVGDIQSGSLYVFWFCDQAAVTGASVDISYRTRFVDV